MDKNRKRKIIEKEIYNKSDEDTARPKWGEQWDRELMNYLLYENSLKRVKHLANMYFKGKDCLILGGGPGESYIFKDGLCNSITLINISEKEIENAKTKYPKHTQFVMGDAEMMNFKDNSFDIVICQGVLHHLNLTTALSEIKRVLCSQGVLFIAMEPCALNPIAFIGRKFFPSNIHTPDEKPFIVRDFKNKLKKENFKEIVFEHFYLVSHSVPIFAKFTGIRNLRWLIDILVLFERFLFKTPLSELCWNFTAVYQKIE
ncbi:hypothetical protein CVT91_08125 [Candidatus Atribacteria bacterium HGW-Atribacteria-1]|nr:MAG: hypothetical protein CVT91_08125 [Candidatus Atribacteria bacterium HGW-Atribacteria-1]